MSEKNKSLVGPVKPNFKCFRCKIIKCKITGEYKLIKYPVSSQNHVMRSTHVMPSYKFTCRTCGRIFKSSEHNCPSCGWW